MYFIKNVYYIRVTFLAINIIRMQRLELNWKEPILELTIFGIFRTATAPKCPRFLFYKLFRTGTEFLKISGFSDNTIITKLYFYNLSRILFLGVENSKN